MTKEEMQLNLANNQYSGEGTAGLNAIYFLLGNPISDSLVVNSFAKTNRAAFELSLKSGGQIAYANNTVAGGNFLYNSLYKFKPFKKINTGTMGLGKRFNLNFISSNEINTAAGEGVREIAEKTGLNATSDVVRTGWGFGRNYNEFFSSLSESGFSLNDLKNKPTAYTFDETVNFIKNSDENVFNKITSKLSGKSLERVNRIRNGFLNAIDDVNIINTLEELEKDFGYKIWNSSNLSKILSKHFNSITAEKSKTIIDNFIKAGGKVKNYNGTITKEILEEASESIGKKFAERTAFEKIISSDFMRIATGAAINLPASVSVPLMIATTGIGVAASTGQTNAINNFINSHLYNTDNYDNYYSEESLSSMYSANQIRDVNLQALTAAYSNINVAERYMNDMDQISLENNNFTLEDAEVM